MFGTGALENNVNVAYSLDIVNKGKMGELLDGKSTVRGAKIEMTISSEITLPGMDTTNIVGDFSLTRNSPIGEKRVNISSPFVPSGLALGSKGNSIASAKATISIGVYELAKKSRNNFGREPKLKFDINASVGITDKSTLGSGVKRTLRISN